MPRHRELYVFFNAFARFERPVLLRSLTVVSRSISSCSCAHTWGLAPPSVAWPRVGPPVPAGPRRPFMLPSLEDFDVAPDGKRFLARIPEVVAAEQPLTAILNWSATARR